MRGPVVRGFEKAIGSYGEGGHQGIDIAAPRGTVVVAAADGTVAWTGELPRGRFVSISHAGGVRTTYLDLDAISVTQGQRISRGQQLGTLFGTRDLSSSATHLHFDACMNGSPVDPRLLIHGFDTGSYIRLCPVQRPGGEQTAGKPAVVQQNGGLWQTLVNPLKSAYRAAAAGIDGFWKGASAAACWLGRGFSDHWNKITYPTARKLGHWIAVGANCCWSNRYVKAVAAGIAAALVIIVVIITLPLSLTVTLIAAIAAGLACLGMAIYYAAVHPSGFSFYSCFFKSLSAGTAVAATVVSFGSLGAAISAGWSEVGLAGVLKCAVGNGILASTFEGSTSYLFTGHISFKRMLVAFAVGAISGPVGKVVKEGVVGSRLVQALIVNFSEGGFAVSARAAVLFLKESGVVLHVTITFLRDGATAFGGKLVYLVFTGSFALCTNLTTCILNHKPITFSGMLASFIAGTAFGALGLAFGGKGLEGLLSRFGAFKDGIGKIANTMLCKLATKGGHKGMTSGLESLFKRLFHEKNPPALIKEE